MDPFLFFSSSFVLFTIILMLVLTLAIIESLHLYFKLSPAQRLQQLFPEQQQKLLYFMGIKDLSFFSVLLVWLINFAIAGYFLQVVCFYYLHHFVNAMWLVFPAFCLASFLTQPIVHWFNQLLPNTPSKETQTELCLLGRVATIYNGTARPGISAQARVRDELGQLHYVQVEPEFGELTVNSDVILFGKNESIYLAKLLPEEQEIS